MLMAIVGALVIGLTLGLMGSGGSILTIPVLVYVLGHQEKAAVAESLAIVGSIALFAMLPYARARLVHWRSVLFFGLPGMGGTYLGAWLSQFISGTVQLLVFAGVMLAASALLFRQPVRPAASEGEPNETKRGDGEQPVPVRASWQIGLQGLAVGTLTGLVGVGGGFLIVPALILLGGLPLRLAVGTSLTVIAMQSASGFWKHLGVLSEMQISIDWATIVLFILIGTAGSLLGKRLGNRIDQRTMRRVFACFLLVMAGFVLAREVPRVFSVPEPVTTTSSELSRDISRFSGTFPYRTSLTWLSSESPHQAIPAYSHRLSDR